MSEVYAFDSDFPFRVDASRTVVLMDAVYFSALAAIATSFAAHRWKSKNKVINSLGDRVKLAICPFRAIVRNEIIAYRTYEIEVSAF